MVFRSGIPVDERVIVKRRDGKTIEGRMIEANETNPHDFTKESGGKYL
jgi:hypothetical protein